MYIGMKLAVTVWNGRIAPLFDVSRHVLVGETEGYGQPMNQLMTLQLQSDDVERKVSALVAIGVSAVICGAISREYEEALAASEIEMDAFVAGDVTDVIAAWEAGTLRQRGFSMPGCACPRHRCMRRGHRSGQMNGRHGGGHGGHW
jgi:predicted Fe-Mo cluster-binding NifX family protein